MTAQGAPGAARIFHLALARDWDRPAIARAMAPHTIAATAHRYLDVCQDALSYRVKT